MENMIVIRVISKWYIDNYPDIEISLSQLLFFLVIMIGVTLVLN